MLVSVRHVTSYAYAAPVRYAIHSLRLTPLDFDGQRVVSWTIEAPGLERAGQFRDAYGNAAHLVTVGAPHDEMTIVAAGVVETADRAGVVFGLKEQMPIGVYRRETHATRPDEAIRDLAANLPAIAPLERLHELMRRLGERMAYRIGVTHAAATAAEVLASGQGVCQDFALVFISAARCIGLPARYVTGYLVADASGPGEAQHAWAEVHVDGLGWVGFDPANGTCPTERYVRLACGLDATAAAPIRGRRVGAAGDDLRVTVEVEERSGGQQ